jgi:vitellogenic carboxypeptidase-like protein
VKDEFKFPIKGIGIGDGFTDPYALLAEMPLFSYNMGLIDYQERS